MVCFGGFNSVVLSVKNLLSCNVVCVVIEFLFSFTGCKYACCFEMLCLCVLCSIVHPHLYWCWFFMFYGGGEIYGMGVIVVLVMVMVMVLLVVISNFCNLV